MDWHSREPRAGTGNGDRDHLTTSTAKNTSTSWNNKTEATFASASLLLLRPAVMAVAARPESARSSPGCQAAQLLLLRHRDAVFDCLHHDERELQREPLRNSRELLASNRSNTE